jgi:hypothetical protein
VAGSTAPACSSPSSWSTVGEGTLLAPRTVKNLAGVQYLVPSASGLAVEQSALGLPAEQSVLALGETTATAEAAATTVAGVAVQALYAWEESSTELALDALESLGEQKAPGTQTSFFLYWLLPVSRGSLQLMALSGVR